LEPILADTSVWIDFFKGRKSPESSLLYYYLSHDEPVLICPPIIQEILQGISLDKDYLRIKEDILSLELISINPVDSAIGAAELYRSLRKKGATIKRSMDCLIAYYAIFYKAALLHKDSDFNIIAKHSSLKIKKTA